MIFINSDSYMKDYPHRAMKTLSGGGGMGGGGGGGGGGGSIHYLIVKREHTTKVCFKKTSKTVHNWKLRLCVSLVDALEAMTHVADYINEVQRLCETCSTVLDSLLKDQASSEVRLVISLTSNAIAKSMTILNAFYGSLT